MPTMCQCLDAKATGLRHSSFPPVVHRRQTQKRAVHALKVGVESSVEYMGAPRGGGQCRDPKGEGELAK